MRLVPVPAGKVEAVWPFVAEWVSQALARGNANQTERDIQQAIVREDMQLWLVWDGKPVGVGVTELMDSPRGRACNLVVVAGEHWPRWRHVLTQVERWAVEEWGCKRITLVGRKGWARRLAGEGWAEAAVTLEKRLEGNGRQHSED